MLFAGGGHLVGAATAVSEQQQEPEAVSEEKTSFLRTPIDNYNSAFVETVAKRTEKGCARDFAAVNKVSELAAIIMVVSFLSAGFLPHHSMSSQCSCA